MGILCCFCGVYFIINDFIYFIDWNIIMLNGRSVIMTFIFDLMSLLFIGFVDLVQFENNSPANLAAVPTMTEVVDFLVD